MGYYSYINDLEDDISSKLLMVVDNTKVRLKDIYTVHQQTLQESIDMVDRNAPFNRRCVLSVEYSISNNLFTEAKQTALNLQ